MTLLSTKPYLIRAIHEWCLDQGLTPYLQVTVDSRCRVPREHVRDGQIVLNVGTSATNQLILGNEDIQFQARFSGAVFSVLVPVDAVAAIYARENGQGMAFEVVPMSSDAQNPTEKSGDAAVSPTSGVPLTGDSVTPRPPSGDSGPTDVPTPPRPAGGRSHLTRIK